MATLQLSTYKPNPQDRRIRDRIKRVLDWAMPKLNLQEPFQCHTNTLDEVFGNYRRGLGEYLAANLLREQSPSYKPKTATRAGFCKTYRISHSGFNKLCGILYGVATLDPSIPASKKRIYAVQYAREKYAEELEGKKPFKYEDISYRLFHELQGFKRELKDQIFEGWHDYDIAAAMPSIFWSLHQQLQERIYENPVVVKSMQDLPSMAHYMSNKTQVRQQLADSLQIDMDAAKRIINGLFQGMRLAPHYTCAAFDLLGYNNKKMNMLKEDPFIKGLQRDIRVFWVRTGRRLNFRRKNRVSKNLLYFYYEREVLEVVKRFLDSTGAVYFLEHDGFRTKEPVDLVFLKALVKRETGFDLTWEEK